LEAKDQQIAEAAKALEASNAYISRTVEIFNEQIAALKRDEQD
jgi:hypothetical protein